MTRDDEKRAFVAKHRHELGGVVADAATVARSGTPLGLFLREAFRRIDFTLAAIFEELTPPEANDASDRRKATGPVQANGKL